MDRAVFFVAINAFEKGRFEQALRVIKLDKELSEQKHNYRNMGRTEYWTGRILDKLKRHEESYSQYELALKKYPLSWYSILAYSRLREVDKKRADAIATKAFNTPGRLNFQDKPTKQGPVWRQARALARHGLAQAAWQSIRKAKTTSGADKCVAKILDASGAVHLLQHSSAPIDVLRRVAPTGDAKFAWEVAFPKPLKGLMGDAAKQAGIPANLAVDHARRKRFPSRIRIERKRDRAHALDRAHSAVYGKERGWEDQWDEPTAPCIKCSPWDALSSTHTLLAVYPLVPAGYNAGGGALKRWLRKRGQSTSICCRVDSIRGSARVYEARELNLKYKSHTNLKVM